MSEYWYPHDWFTLNLVVVFDYLVYSSLYLSFAAGFMAYISSVLHEVSFNPAVFVLGMLITYSVYNLNRKTDESEDAINHSKRYGFTKKYERLLFSTAIGAYILALAISWLYGPAVVVISAIPLISGVVYSAPVFPRGFPYRRLKEIPVAKSLIVAVAWALPPTLLPVYIAGAFPDTITLAAILFFFSLVFINTVLFDMRDVEGDRLTGVRTIPVCIGIAATTLLLKMVNIIFGVTVVLLLWNKIPLAYIMLIVMGIFYAHWYIRNYRKISESNLLCDLIADGQFIALGLLMVVIVAVSASFNPAGIAAAI
ncbi:MAG TPA: UbiA family prenyltransferase [Methanoregulaceae archaeon]|nr:MAG: UbiA family prenyltransferase [Methanolinea sp.]HON82277.1 UbiA family prenyltransferase [Methanoregulaceae archaeon]HPD09843.1 UbiA family prenyltransferase [Methanoregulaceae archaeon]HRT14966.1 UbiA family prenyltransferase [Methanoregulaceae archaeon]HRU30419.1 UbiA family prenyltransferase [Methanoregulaceae archaeon]